MAIKVGTEDKKKVYLASGLGLVMLILLVRFLWQTFGPSPSPAAAPPPPTVVTAPRPATTPSGGETVQEMDWAKPCHHTSPNQSLPYARRTSIPVLRRLRRPRLSISGSMAMRRRGRGKNKSSCCTAMTSLSPRKGMLSIAVIGW